MSVVFFGLQKRPSPIANRHLAIMACTALASAGFFSPPARSADEPPPSPIIRASFKDLAACPVKISQTAAGECKAGELTELVRGWNGRCIEITGYMLPLVLQGGRAQQVLILRNQLACCYGQMPTANEYLIANLPAPGVVVTMDLPVTFRGTFRVAPVLAGDQVVQFYSLDNSTVTLP